MALASWRCWGWSCCRRIGVRPPREAEARGRFATRRLLVGKRRDCGPGIRSVFRARDGSEEWRTMANDAVNCLYLQLAILGHPVDYSGVREAVFANGGVVSIVALREAAGRRGLP